mmetsp:Transcript_11348/g.17847  ORF Transcript_11348/g.17847 Transcript_11348/m.17847 type:complete len:465 (-) Transcript_11348:178-1572(-)|eukprot:CAMPEP_0184304768 /NCGR_PEP_ID=MMETSP1049-20130417/14200_1 /TAXON_ID=77928 /ORGANISM="Proteomonas sulcata, Strain CCMP704" /LENGTH=464 /DNA_ID=CAMNT_0026616655 /DNA_START=83 /DNA_END=1477 /DNA_ORIENTATION=+
MFTSMRPVLGLVLLPALCSAFSPSVPVQGLNRALPETMKLRQARAAPLMAMGDEQSASRRQLLSQAAVLAAAGALGLGSPKFAEAMNLEEAESEQEKLFEDAVPSVCFISTDYTSMAESLNLDASALPKGVGSGFVWDNKGHIVTNFHVINKVDSATVTMTLSDGTTKQYKAKLTGVDPDKDIAVLKIDAPAESLRKMPVGVSKSLKVGQFTYAIGNPFGQDHTLTTGVVSGKNRLITAPTGRKITGVIQTDAAINPGNSGGPLLDRKGNVIGINTASLGSGVSAGVGFAVPIDVAKPVIQQIIDFGQVQRAILGISYLERLPTALESQQSGIPRIENGIVVLEVPPTSPAAGGGMKAVERKPNQKPVLGDVIVGINDFRIKNPQELTATLEKFKPGDKVLIKVLRGVEQEQKDLEVTLGSFKGNTFTKLENERGDDFTKDSAPMNIPLGEIAPQITPKMPAAN